jgi:glycosyltransferase involved in cell wall biosynthesis
MTPFISIVTVSLNAAGTIEDTLASVVHQRTGFRIEQICVDGGSNDATRSAIDGWVSRASIPIHRIYEPDKGIFDAMNKGMRAASGEYVLFLNADDFLVSADTLAASVAGLTPGAAENPDLIVGDASMGDPGKRGVWRHRRVPKLLGRMRGLYPVHQGQFTKRRLMEETGGFDTSLKLAADLTKYYDLEFDARPTIRRLGFDVAFMRAGGVANAGMGSMRKGSAEIYRHLVQRHHFAKAIGMVLVKTMQSVSELRVGRCPDSKWFAGMPGEQPGL